MGWFHAVLTSTYWNEICIILSDCNLARQVQQILPNQVWLWSVGVRFKKSTSHGESSPAGLTSAQKGLQMRLLIKIAAPSTHYPILCGRRIFKIFNSKFPTTPHLMRRTNQSSITNHSYTVITIKLHISHYPAGKSQDVRVRWTMLEMLWSILDCNAGSKILPSKNRQ